MVSKRSSMRCKVAGGSYVRVPPSPLVPPKRKIKQVLPPPAVKKNKKGVMTRKSKIGEKVKTVKKFKIEKNNTDVSYKEEM